MKTKFICIIFASIAVIAFIFGTASDISLSSGAAKNNESEAALVGMFVTKEYVPGRINAVLEEYTDIIEETGEKVTHKEYVFKNIEGFPFYHCEIQDINGDYGYLHTDGIVSDINSLTNVSDNGEENIITGTLYTVDTDGNFYANPVYQSEDGKVWLEPGDSIGASGYGLVSIKLGNEIKVKTGKKTTTKKYEAELKIEYADPVKELIISEMDENDVLLRKTSYNPAEIPTEYSPQKSTEYIIVNTLYYDVEGTEQQKRNAYDETDTDFTYMEIRDDGIGFNKCSEISWNNE